MQFSKLNLKAKYDSDEDEILTDFYKPLLKRAVKYDRAVGFFSSRIFQALGDGLESFIKSGGSIRLIIGDPLNEQEYEAVISGKLLRKKTQERQAELSEILFSAENKYLKILTYLIANQQLEIKFAFTFEGMFHKKIGIFQSESETVVFSGSANETLSGLSRYNSEEISVFFSWKDSFLDYGQPEIDDFQKLWGNSKKRTRVVSLDSEFYKKLQDSTDKKALYREIFESAPSIEESDPTFFFKYKEPKSSQKIIVALSEHKRPCLPSIIKGRPFKLFPHQQLAMKSWVNSNFRGLMKLATGAGKTFTSICAMVELYEARMVNQESTVAVVSVPYIELANQWVRELSPFNISAVRCYENSELWQAKLNKKILRFNAGNLSFFCIVVVNKTLSSVGFQKQLRRLDTKKMLFIGDECHRLGSDNLIDKLPLCRYRLGLSATPFRSEDEEIDGEPFPDISRKNLLKYFGGIISEYSLSDAISDGVLTPYTYDIVPVYLTEKEQEYFEELSGSIQRLVIKAGTSHLLPEERQYLTNLCGKRSRLLATCEGKLPALLDYIKSNPKLSLSHSLIYVGEGCAVDEDIKFVNKVTYALFQHDIRVAKFTSTESSVERKRVMNSFKSKDIDALVAMKVLDEGIDVPVCETAFILASTRNPRQYVQRRGRVLRTYPGKTSAKIVDFVVLPFANLNNNHSQNLRKSERDRIEDFKLTAINAQEVEQKMMSLGVK